MVVGLLGSSVQSPEMVLISLQYTAESPAADC